MAASTSSTQQQCEEFFFDCKKCKVGFGPYQADENPLSKDGLCEECVADVDAIQKEMVNEIGKFVTVEHPKTGKATKYIIVGNGYSAI